MRQEEYHKKREFCRPKTRNIPSRAHTDNVGVVTLKHGYHKPYQNDWRQATAKARMKIWELWHAEKED